VLLHPTLPPPAATSVLNANGIGVLLAAGISLELDCNRVAGTQRRHFYIAIAGAGIKKPGAAIVPDDGCSSIVGAQADFPTTFIDILHGAVNMVLRRVSTEPVAAIIATIASFNVAPLLKPGLDGVPTDKADTLTAPDRSQRAQENSHAELRRPIT